MPKEGFSVCICPDSALLLQHLESMLTEQEQDRHWERHVFWGDDELSRQFWEELTLQGFVSTSRAIVVRNAQNLHLNELKQLSAALGRPNPQVWPIICLECPWEKEKAKIPAGVTKLPFFTFAKKQKWVWEQNGLTSSTLRGYIRNRSKALDLNFDDASFARLCEFLPPDASAVETELSKLALLVGKERKITLTDLGTLGSVPDFDIFTLLKRLESGQSASVWRAILQEKVKGGDPLFFLLSMLQREARQLWQLLAGEQIYIRQSDLADKKQTAYSLKNIGIARLWNYLYNAEYDVKSGKFSPDNVLDRLIRELTILFKPLNRR